MREQQPGNRFAVRDVAEIALGACIMAFPVAVTEEVWNLGTVLVAFPASFAATVVDSLR